MKTTIFMFMALIGISFQSVAQEQAVPSQVEIAGPVLMVTDLERSLKFYIEGLGLEVGSRLPGKPGPGATIISSKQQSSPFVLLRQRSAGIASSAQPLTLGNGLSRIMLVVQDSVATAARLKAAGFKPNALSARGIFFVEDPDGYRYEIMPRR